MGQLPARLLTRLLATRSNNLLVAVLNVDPRTDTFSFILAITLSPGLVLERVKLGAGGILPEQDPALEPPRQGLCQLIFSMSTSWDTEDVVQLFQSTLLGLVQEEEDHPEGDKVHGGVEAECTLDAEGLELSREGDGDYRGPEVVGSYGPGHANFSMGEREDFCRVGERNGSFSRGVESIVDVYEESHQAKMRPTALRNPVAHPGEEETPAHVRECKEEQGSTSKRVNSPDRREGEDEIDNTKAEGCQKSDNIVCSRLDEDGG
jgi:hypothetical protein